ncbi:MAG: hypothetical protein GY757_56700 [bacterium]|nr:hypothetical protein [bacterium]
MLRTMRNDFKKYSWTLWLVIIVFLVGFSFMDIFEGKSRSKDALIYIGDSVVQSDVYRKQLMRTLQNYKQQFKTNFNKQMITQMGIPEQIMQSLINTAIIGSEAEKLNITASTEELREKIKTLPGLQKDGKFVGTKEYHLRLSYNKINVEEFEESLKKEIVREKFQEVVTSGLVIDNDTLMEKFKKEKDNAELDYIVFNLSRIKETPAVEDSEISDYYSKHKEDFKSPELRSGNIVALNFDDYKKDLKITDTDLLEIFKSNKAKYKAAGKTKISRILLKYTNENREDIFKKAEALQKELTKENFAAKAKEFSEDAKAQQGGDHGYFAWRRFTPQEKTILEELKENEISSPVGTDQGFAILTPTEKVAERAKDFGEVKKMIRDSLEKQRLNEIVSKKISEIHDKIKNSPNIKADAEKLGVKVVETALLKSGDPIKDVDNGGYISRELFKLKEKEVSVPITFQKGMALLQIIKTQAPAVEPLDKVKEKVKKEVITGKKIELLIKDARDVYAKLKDMSDQKKIDEFLKKKDLKADALTYKRGNRLSHFPEKKGLDDSIFAMSENVYAAPIEFKSDAVIVKLKKKTVTGQEDFDKEKSEFSSQKLTELKSSYFSSYVTKKRESYDVKINQQLFEEVKNRILARFN